MKPLVLRAHIRPLPEYLPSTKAMEEAIGVGVGFDDAWYRSQKQHWLGWLAEYDGPGAYGRSDAAQRNGAYIYNHIQCAPMLFWLAEACGIQKVKLVSTFEAVVKIESKGARQCAALRKRISWADIELSLLQYDYSLAERFRIKIANHSIWNGGQNGGRKDSKKT